MTLTYKGMMYKFLLLAFLLLCSSCNQADSTSEDKPSEDKPSEDKPSEDKPSEEKNVLIPEGLYEKPIGEFADQEPIRSFLEMRNLSAQEKWTEAGALTTWPENYIEKTKRYRERVGNAAYVEQQKNLKEKLILHSVYHEPDQSLLVVKGRALGAMFFQRKNGTFQMIETGGPVKISPTLNRKFYIAKGEPDAVLAE